MKLTLTGNSAQQGGGRYYWAWGTGVRSYIVRRMRILAGKEPES